MTRETVRNPHEDMMAALSAKAVPMEELEEAVTGAAKFRFFHFEICKKCGYSECMVGNRHLKVCPNCGGTDFEWPWYMGI